MIRKVMPVVFLILILFAGFMALTQEFDFFLPGFVNLESGSITSGWARPPRWFRSNAGGMVVEETRTRAAALQNEFALNIIYANQNEIPVFLLPYITAGNFLEIHILYRNSRLLRTQWLLRDAWGNTRLNAVLFEPNGSNTTADNITLNINVDTRGKSGFIEIFDENSLLITEHRFFASGDKSRIDYEFSNNLLISSSFFSSENNGEYNRIYADYFRYNRSLSLRYLERVFYSDLQITIDPVHISIPRRVMDAIDAGYFVAERLNLYPGFFGDVFVDGGSRIIYDTDDRGRVLNQTFFDEEDNIAWAINNTWQNNRIVLTTKTEGNNIYTAEYEYNSDGEKILERNYTNGVLDRVVRTQGNIDIEELYINNVVVLRAVWENGRKISETMVR